MRRRNILKKQINEEDGAGIGAGIGVEISPVVPNVDSTKVFQIPIAGSKTDDDVRDAAAQLYIEKRGSKERLHQRRSEWRLLAAMMDRLFFFLFLSAIIIMTVTIFTVASVHNTYSLDLEDEYRYD